MPNSLSTLLCEAAAAVLWLMVGADICRRRIWG